MRRYKTKETAIRNIRKGRSFNRIEFYPFWKDKEVCWEAHDDEEFVLDALLGYGIHSRVLMFRTSSYRIRKAVGDNDPIEFLKAAALTKRLEASLSHKTEDTMSKVNRVKI